MAAQLTRCVIPAASARMSSAAQVRPGATHQALVARLWASPSTQHVAACPARPLSAVPAASGDASAHSSLSSSLSLSPSASAFRRAALLPVRVSGGPPATGAPAEPRAEAQSLEELPEDLRRIVQSFQMVPDPRARYQQLLYYASKLKPLAKEFQTPENKVKGCVSQVWVLPTLHEDGRVYFQAESDSQLTKGLAALLVEGLSGATPQQVVALRPNFISLLGLKQSLTPSRNNGFLNMLLLMQRRTLHLYAHHQAMAAANEQQQQQHQQQQEQQEGAAAADGSQAEEAGRGAAVAVAAAAAGAGAAGGAAAAAGGQGQAAGGSGEGGHGGQGEGQVPVDPSRPLFSSMTHKLSKALSPSSLDIEDVSYQHAGHSGNPSGAGETHFNVRVVSSAFEGLPTIRRHRLIYGLLEDEFKQGLHALSLVTRTPAEEEKLSARS